MNAAFDHLRKCSHTFNLLQARGAISVAMRQVYVNRIRQVAQRVAEAQVRHRQGLGFPLLTAESADV